MPTRRHVLCYFCDGLIMDLWIIYASRARASLTGDTRSMVMAEWRPLQVWSSRGCSGCRGCTCAACQLIRALPPQCRCVIVPHAERASDTIQVQASADTCICAERQHSCRLAPKTSTALNCDFCSEDVVRSVVGRQMVSAHMAPLL